MTERPAIPPRWPQRALTAIALYAAALVAIAGVWRSYDAKTAGLAAIGCVLLVATAGVVHFYPPRMRSADYARIAVDGIAAGLALGVLWMVEIGYNNFLAPPLPGRDHVDNTFWAVIAAGMLVVAARAALRAGRFVPALIVGAWSGVASGAVACAMAVSMVVFGTRFLTADPINVTEWAARSASSGAPDMASYFAFETLAGGLLHLIVLGVVMGGLLGAIGGTFGVATTLARRWAAPRR